MDGVPTVVKAEETLCEAYSYPFAGVATMLNVSPILVVIMLLDMVVYPVCPESEIVKFCALTLSVICSLSIGMVTIPPLVSNPLIATE